MPKPEDPSKEALRRLDKDLDAFDAQRKAPASWFIGAGDAGSEGYRIVAGMIGGLFGGLGLGWFFDHLAHTSPWGLISGLLIGSVGSIYLAIRTAAQMSAREVAKSGLAPPVTDDEEE